jgi:hypothetical protein
MKVVKVASPLAGRRAFTAASPAVASYVRPLTPSFNANTDHASTASHGGRWGNVGALRRIV